MKLFRKRDAHKDVKQEATTQEATTQDVSRRQFVTSVAGAAGAGLLLGKAAVPAWADGSAPMDKSATAWPASFNPQETAPQYNPRDMPKAGEVIHKFEMEEIGRAHV